MPRKIIIGGNWKANPAKLADAAALCEAWETRVGEFNKDKVDVVIAPPALWVLSMKEKLDKMGFATATQNVSKTGFGAFTGETPVESLKDSDISWCLIGHSERRTKYGETDEETAEKLAMCQTHGINVLFCIGETLPEREANKTDEVNQRMLSAVLSKVTDWSKVVIAYEPVWAIGTGKVATPQQAEDAHKAIRDYMKTAVSAEVAEAVRIQYGGSVSPDNCKELLSQPNIDGFLVGGASLKPSFMDIIASANQ